jgi:hypothetical protein
VVEVKFSLSGLVTCMGDIRVRHGTSFRFLFGMIPVESELSWALVF